jgi:hypothetical protein
MTQTQISEIRMLEARAAELSTRWILVATNEGTFGATEALRACGTGDPAFASYRTYARISGARKHEGADPKSAPGRPRHFSCELTAAKEELTVIKEALGLAQRLAAAPSWKPLPNDLWARLSSLRRQLQVTCPPVCCGRGTGIRAVK